MFATLLGAFSTLLYALDRDIISVSDVPILYVDSPFITRLRNPRDPLQVYVHLCLQTTRLCFRSMSQGTGRNVPNSPYRRSCGKSAWWLILFLCVRVSNADTSTALSVTESQPNVLRIRRPLTRCPTPATRNHARATFTIT